MEFFVILKIMYQNSHLLDVMARVNGYSSKISSLW